MTIAFFCPDITEGDVEAVVDVLRSGWITSGPQVAEFEKLLTHYSQTQWACAMFSATAALEIALKIYGVGPGDEVITTPYTYAATANVIVHLGAKPVFVDVLPGAFNIDPAEVGLAITEKTKAIIPVDIGGLPCDYHLILKFLNDRKYLFSAKNKFQEHLGRPLILSDAAHSLGARMADGKMAAQYADVTAFSFHAVKNLTTAEGGALCLSSIWGVLGEDFLREAKLWSLHGQSKDALSKQKGGEWRYDIIHPGYKCNMTDIQAALGLSQLKRYAQNLERRREIFAQFSTQLGPLSRAIIPDWIDSQAVSSYHLFPLRIKGMSEPCRDKLIYDIYAKGISLNVHFQPLPLLTAYKKMGYHMQDYPWAYDQYQNEVSLPLYPQLTQDQIDYIIQNLKPYLE
ncbi:MAG: DegT/DnrJ/EryC1/StrS family aminotransferase [Spirochaetia bacterium]